MCTDSRGGLVQILQGSAKCRGNGLGETNIFTSSGLVREIADFICNHGEIPTHPDWIETLACTPISMMAGRDRFMHNKFGPLPSNIFGIVVGSSGLSFKTVPLKNLRDIVKELTNRVNDATCAIHGITLNDYLDLRKSFFKQTKLREGTPGSLPKELQEKKSRIAEIDMTLVNFESPTKFTSEGLANYLVRNPTGIILGDEYTKMFKGADRKTFLVDNMEDLSRLYDCSPDKAVTVTRGTDYPEDAFINFVSATTYYLLTLMTDDFFIQGTGNRILWTLDDLEGRTELTLPDPNFYYNYEQHEERQKELTEIVNKIMSVDRLPKKVIWPEWNAEAMLENARISWYNQGLRLAKVNPLDKDSNYLSRCAQNAMKLAMIHCMGRKAVDLYENQGEYIDHLEIMPEDVKWAVDKVQRHMDHYLKMMKMAPNVRKGAFKDARNDFELVMLKIEQLIARNQKPTVKKLFHELNRKYTIDDLQHIIDDLMRGGQLDTRQEMIDRGPHTGKLVIYYVPVQN